MRITLPELPDLEVAKNVLNQRILGRIIEDINLRSPVLLRRPTAEIFKTELQTRTVGEIQRYGKFLIFHFSPPARLYLNPMLAGRLILQPSSDSILRKTGFRLSFSGQLDLRYHDVRNMGKLYLLLEDEPTTVIPTFDQQGPDALDPILTLAVFRERIRKFHAMIKHVLLNQRFIAGIGNAYADEILFAAHILPFRKRKTLSPNEIDALYVAMKAVLRNAIAIISQRSGHSLKFEVRDFLQVHGKGGESCPICGTPLSSVKSGLRVANFCRRCQK